MDVQFHPDAILDLDDAACYYQSLSDDIGREFLVSFKRGMQQIVEYPEVWGRVSTQTRRYLLKRFPYGIIYRPLPQQIQIVAVFHTSRDPKVWRDRLSSTLTTI